MVKELPAGAVAESHQVAVLIELFSSGAVVGALDEVLAGSGVTLDRTAATRGRCNLTLVDDGSLGIVPLDPTGGTLLETGKQWSRQGAFNRVIVTGESTSTDTAPPRAVATDDDPNSPTYYFGPFGKVPRFYSSEFITTAEQAADAAAGILANELGTTQQVSFGAVADPTLEPSDLVRLARKQTDFDLAPYGTELRISRGIEFTNRIELVRLGVFRIDELEIVEHAGEQALRLSGLDRSASVSDAKFEEPYEVAAGTLFTTAIQALILHAIPDAVFDFASTALTTPKLVAQEGEDRWAFAQGMATAIGTELYFGREGEAVLRPVPTAVGEPVATLAEGADENHVIDSLTIPLEAEGSMSGQTRATLIEA
ncbi:MAG: DUF5047 domain-containing protein [Gaiellaceae bacterium]